MKNDYVIKGEITVIYLKRKDGTIKETTISTSDLDKLLVLPFSWYACHDQKTNAFYVRCDPTINGKKKSVYLHRFIKNCPKGFVVDHINHNTLDNTRENLRVITATQNKQNRKGANKNSTTGIRGVSLDANSGKWKVQYKLNNKKVHVGLYDDLKEAEKAAIEVRKEHMLFSKENNLGDGELWVN